MAKKQQPKSIQIDTYTAGIFGRTEGYADRVRQLYANAVTELLKLTASQGIGEDETFEFDKLPKRLREEANKILRLLYASVYNEVQHGIRAEWQYANLSNDIIIKRIFGDAVFKNEGNHFARWFARNEQAMDAFLKRKSGPKRLGLSERIWNYTGQLKDEMELALSVSMGEGESSSSISRRVRQYLQEPDRLFRHVKGKDGKMRWSKAAKEYLKTHDVGRGQYLSSYKNAMRLTRTETNMAYRSADCERWQQLDFVLGIHIERSKRGEKFECELCDQLAGDYPKGFNFTGWHPQCRCIATPILATVDEMVAMRKAMKEGKNPRSVLAPGRYVTEPPRGFTDWVANNRERIENAASVPYFIRDNFKDGNIDNGYSWVKTKRQKSQAEKDAIAAQWNERKRHNALITKMGNNVYNVAAQYPDVDVTELVAAINSGQISKIEQQAKAVAQQVGKLNKQLAGMTSLIDDPKQWMKQGFKVSELQTCHDNVQKTLQGWKDKYQTDSWLKSKYATESDYLLHKLQYEIADVINKKKYSTWQVAQSAYSKQYNIEQDKKDWFLIKQQQTDLDTKLASGLYAHQIDVLDKAVSAHNKTAAQAQIAVLQQWVKINDVLEEAMAFKTKSTPYLDLITQLQNNIMAGDLAASQSTVTAMQAKRQELAKKKAQRTKGKATGIEVTDKELTKKPTNADIVVMAGRLAERRLSDARKGKAFLTTAQTDAYRELADAVRLKDETKVLDLLKRLGDDLTSTYGAARKDAAVWAQTEKEADDTFFDNAVKTYALSSADERTAIRSYTRASGYITKFLRGIDGYLEYDYSYAQMAEKHSNDMTSYIARSRMEHDIWLKRDEICAFATYRWGLNVTELCDAEMKRVETLNEITDLQHQISSYAGKAILTDTEKAQLQTWDKRKKKLESDLTKITQTAQSLVGRIGTDDSFMSCGSCRGTNFSGTGGDNKYGRPRVILNIFCPAGTCATYADPFNYYTNGNSSKPWDGKTKHSYTGENEFFMQRGTTMRVTKAEYDYSKDILFLDVEIISQKWPDFEIESVSGGGYKAKFK